MFGLRKRFSMVKPPASVVRELEPLLDGDGHPDMQAETLDISMNSEDPNGPKAHYDFTTFEKLQHSLSSISDSDVSQTSDDTDGEEAVPLAVKESRRNGNVLPHDDLNGTNIDIERTTSPEVLADGLGDAVLNGDEVGADNQTRPLNRARHSSFRSRRNSTTSTSWLGLDISIIIALVSPIGNLLTGGDHVKNLLLLVLLVYYLHQLVEVPWTLYRMSIPKQSLRLAEESDGDGKRSQKNAVHNELRALELCYLILTVLSPFLGATLLRYVATSISGDKSTLSWFSTTLFVLATGIRPWSHLIERLKDRSEALNSILEEMADVPETNTEARGESDEKTVQLSGKVDEIRRRLDTMDFRLVGMHNTNMTEWDDLADAIDSVDDSIKKLRSESEKKQQAQETRLDALEAYVLGLQYEARAAPSEPPPLLAYLRGQQLRALFWELAALPWTIGSLLWAGAKRVARDAQRASSARPKHHGSPPLPKTPTKVKFAIHTHAHGHSRSNAARAPTLEPILEEEALHHEENMPTHNAVRSPTTGSHVNSSRTKDDNPEAVDPLAYAVAQGVLLVFSPVIIIAKWCIAFVKFPAKVLRALLM